ncbi:bifunctional 4-hydroxy-3-methylbut-2-enyl diphosphate reductase/30S ribosomal protein S1 [Acetobacterium sp.]|uniref:bifunctional 4-hydroxy-3-methylbut-2-enyl diphosphate reductase/30S ribosomal protein S1 n=1 Tax=Acetobacterium sp. TaxID=1872094 RepID=UPI00271A632B|nr:bifunctional 4-hydroxy-3-methylbut-2-enyl diphosphate reductase/30S ribosomal protein S1 [Acetobacterium sp.]MDO9492075.1 bifunctional 4-hydroxy-3-methylbut-2-enyl diphosphate reductase/30S ribosomal protein S1 [Acetobacterium sp.]
MEIIIAEKAGYCFGIENAMKMVRETIESGQEKIYTLGPISHNTQETMRLADQGVVIITDDEVNGLETGCIILRSHGVGKKIIETIKGKGLPIINATCPFVRAVQKKVESYDATGYQIVIVGNKDHPEVIGANGWCQDKALIISDINQLENIESYDRICIVAQTTIIESRFNEICDAIRSRVNEVVIFNTICSATAERQAAAAKTAKEVEYMIVIGGYHSSNTQKLADICKSYCAKTCHIETIRDLDLAEVMKYQKIGITAGASTPDWIVKEVLEGMEEQNKIAEENVVVEVTTEEQPTVVVEEVVETIEKDEYDDANFDFAAEIEESLKTIRRGAEIEGEVIHIAEDEVILNIGYKADGIIKKNDFTWRSDEVLSELVQLGDKVWCIVTDLNEGSGNVKLSKIKYDNRLVQKQLSDAFDNKTILEGTIKDISGNGLIVDIGFTDIYMPASQYHVRYVKDLNTLIGEKVKGIIIDYNPKRRRAILSQKIILEKDMKERREQVKEMKDKRFDELNVDDVVKGVVKTITNFGIFVDLDGIDGFVHRSDLTWEKINEPKDIVEKGQEIEAKVIAKNEEDKKIKLSVKALMDRPWDDFIAKYNVDDEVEVTITNILDFGAFAEVIPGVEGLIHVSEISYNRVESVASVLNTGDVLTVKIIGINPEKEKISLSKKATEEAPARPAPTQRSSSNSSSSNAGSGDRDRTSNYGGGDRNRRPQQNHNSNNNRNKTVYEETANVTLGDAFADMFSGLTFEDSEDDK